MTSLRRATLALLSLLALACSRGAPRVRPSGRGPVRFPAAIEPRNDIRMDNRVPIRMRDGVTLYADIYRPVGEGRYPVIVSLTRYSTERFPSAYATGVYLARRGYVYVYPDVRGRHESEGVWEPFLRGAGRLRHGRVGGQAAVVRRQGRDARRILPGTEPVARGPGRAAQPRDDLPERRLDEPLPRLDHPERGLAPVVQLRVGPHPAGVAHHAEREPAHRRGAPRDS